MGEVKIPPDVERLLSAHINSVEQLEVLLFLFHNSDQLWTVAIIQAELRADYLSIANRLESLAKAGLIKKSGEISYVYTKGLKRNDETLLRLQECYRERRYAVINYIFSKPLSHIQTFADAFKIKKD